MRTLKKKKIDMWDPACQGTASQAWNWVEITEVSVSLTFIYNKAQANEHIERSNYATGWNW